MRGEGRIRQESTGKNWDDRAGDGGTVGRWGVSVGNIAEQANLIPLIQLPSKYTTAALCHCNNCKKH